MTKSITALTSLFLQTSLQDSEADYRRSVTNAGFPHWDAVVITASNRLQAEGYMLQIESRRSRLPQNTAFLVIPDEGDKRVGSAGSTLSVIRELKSRFGDLSDKRFLVIHAGGNSSRCPQYSALGKLFAPLPTMLGDKPATLFDMFLVTMASVPGRMKNGMLLLSGDVTLLFNPLMCDFGDASAAVISFTEDVETGKDHGVYVKNPVTGNVKSFLHKQPVEVLRDRGAVDRRNLCSIDTGAIWLCPEILDRLFSLVDTDVKYHSVVNDTVRLSLYSDIAYCLAEDSTLARFQNETPEGSFCPELTAVREKLWNVIGSYNMKLMNLAPAKFVHFGSIPEILDLVNTGVEEYTFIGWEKQIGSSLGNASNPAYNSVLNDGAIIGDGSFLEVSYVRSGAVIGKNSYVSFVDLHRGDRIPDNVLVHGLRHSNGKFTCRIMNVTDNPKSNYLFGIQLSVIGNKLGAKLSETLWDAMLYPECDSIDEAVQASLNLYDLVVNDSGDLDQWQSATKKSLCSGFNDADPKAIIDWNQRMEELVQMDEFANAIRSGIPASTIKPSSAKLSEIQKKWVADQFKDLDPTDLSDFSYAIRLHYYLGTVFGEEEFTASCYQLIAQTVLHSTLAGLNYRDQLKIASDEVVVRLPLRVNWGGGWTDTCPHCLEHGGIVLNAAIAIDGKYPVEVRLVKIPEHKIVFDSRDMDVHGEFTDIAPLQETGNPFDPFSLQKACLLACGIIPKTGGNLDAILTRLGGGFVMHSEVKNVPKGSGLGTSSILSAAAVKAMLRFVGAPFTEETLYSTVLAMEQIMSTGGGWQDQVGGLIPGIKLVSSSRGIDQRLNVEHIHLSDATKSELNERFAIIYTGQRRLARNLLRDVLGRYIGNEPDSLYAHREIQKIANSMRLALENGNVDEFARLLDQHWSLSKKIDSGSSNSLIEQIFIAIDDLIDARMCCGAGGGGFLQVVLKKGVTKGDVHHRLKDVFLDFAVDVWESAIVYEINA